MKYQIQHHYRGRTLHLQSVSGLYGRDQVPDATRFLLDQAPEGPLGKILDLGCGYGTIGLSLAPQAEITFMVDSDLRAVNCARQNLQFNHLDAQLELNDHLDFLNDNSLDHIFFNPPVNLGAELIKSLLLEALTKLKTDGRLWMVAKKDKGIGRYAKILKEAAGFCEVVFRKRGYQVLVAEKHHQWEYRPEDFQHEIISGDLLFRTEAGLFSRKELDPGSTYLLSTLSQVPPGRILDLGCGYGYLGLSLAQRTGQEALLLDVDFKALRLARKNILENGLSRVQALHSDGYSAVPPGGKFGLIVSNPPFHQGQEVIGPFLKEARKRLDKKGKWQS
jgi:16S rRNA (guanine1207-N2)-methyltransferase